MLTRYDPQATEAELQARWEAEGTYRFDRERDGPVYTIDTPPPTVSGYLHLGHVYSYSQADFMARYRRMRGDNVFYPIGYDDNGLATERLVERRLGQRAAEIGRREFIRRCLEVSDEIERDYEALWRRLALSIDWRHQYRTIDDLSRRTAQWSFLDLYRRGLAYRADAPAIWCPECRTAIAQAELNDLERESEFVSLAFTLDGGATLPIATTRPELLPACVAIFVHPGDPRFAEVLGRQASVPLFGQSVPILADERADPEKGTGAVMCCTFGDTTDVEWWRLHGLPLRVAIDREGRLTELAGEFAGLPVAEARRRIVNALSQRGQVLGREPVHQSVRVHERCDTAVEYIVTPQWFVRVLDFKAELIAAGERITWHPAYMGARYREWVENLGWDWCLSRQRYYGVTFPVWYCDACGETVPADEAELPVDPTDSQPSRPCRCGSTAFTPETDIMDTWATSSLSPQIVGRYLTDPDLYRHVHPFSVRTQAHEIIRTWAFYTIVKSRYHFGMDPWREVAISGWGLAPEGTGKISKSRGGGPVAPMALIERYSADAVRYWAASTGFGKDAVISEEKVQAGAKLVTKLWNVARFAERFAGGGTLDLTSPPPYLAPADRWLLSRAQRLVRRATALFDAYDYATAKSEIEAFFWRELADNYLEMAKNRLYDGTGGAHQAARWTLFRVLDTVLRLFAPFLPHLTEAIYRELFATPDHPTLHHSSWPTPDPALEDDAAEAAGEALMAVAAAVRRYKSAHSLSLGSGLDRVQVAASAPPLLALLRNAEPDLLCVTRAREVEISTRLDPALEAVPVEGEVAVAVARAVPEAAS